MVGYLAYRNRRPTCPREDEEEEDDHDVAFAPSRSRSKLRKIWRGSVASGPGEKTLSDLEHGREQRAAATPTGGASRKRRVDYRFIVTVQG